jgi:hypothetical protein
MTPGERKEGIEALRFVKEEAEAQWQAVLEAHALDPLGHTGRGRDVLACRWLLICAPEPYVEMIMQGLPIGQVLEWMRDRHGHPLPPEIEPVYAEWYAKIVAYDLTRPSWERSTPEGRKAAVSAEKKHQKEARAKERQIKEPQIKELVRQRLLTWSPFVQSLPDGEQEAILKAHVFECLRAECGTYPGRLKTAAILKIVKEELAAIKQESGQTTIQSPRI